MIIVVVPTFRRQRWSEKQSRSLIASNVETTVLSVNSKQSVLSVQSLVQLKSTFKKAYVAGQLQGTSKPLFKANLWLEELHHIAGPENLAYWPYSKSQNSMDEQSKLSESLELALDPFNSELVDDCRVSSSSSSSLEESRSRELKREGEQLSPLGLLSMPDSKFGEIKHGEIKDRDAKDEAHMVRNSAVSSHPLRGRADRLRFCSTNFAVRRWLGRL